MNGSQYSAKRKKLVTKQYDKKLFVIFYTLMKFLENFLRMICNMLKRQMKGWKFPTDFVCPLPLRVLGGSKNWLEIFTIILFSSKIVSVTHSLSLKLMQHNVFLSSLSVQRYQNPICRQYLTENILHSEHDKLGR